MISKETPVGKQLNAKSPKMFAQAPQGLVLTELNSACSEHPLTDSCYCKSIMVAKDGDLHNHYVSPVSPKPANNKPSSFRIVIMYNYVIALI